MTRWKAATVETLSSVEVELTSSGLAVDAIPFAAAMTTFPVKATMTC